VGAVGAEPPICDRPAIGLANHVIVAGGGAGGGGASSFVETAATHVQNTQGAAPTGNGQIVISW
jgi:hypothetical protein